MDAIRPERNPGMVWPVSRLDAPKRERARRSFGQKQSWHLLRCADRLLCAVSWKARPVLKYRASCEAEAHRGSDRTGRAPASRTRTHQSLELQCVEPGRTNITGQARRECRS